jgi:heat shock protein HtpX
MTRSTAVRRSAAAYVVFMSVIAVIELVVLLIAGFGILFSLAGAVALSLVLGLARYLTADAAALRALGARELAEGELPRLENLVDGLAVAHGFRSPALYVVDDGAPNAAVVGRTSKHGALVVTTGLLDRLRRIELEGVLAHELSRVRSGETVVNVTAGVLVGKLFGFSDRMSMMLAGRLVDDDLALRADMAGSELTRYPPGLIAALSSMRRDGRVVKTNPRAYRHLWVNVPEGAIVAQAFSLDDRIAVLQEL